MNAPILKALKPKRVNVPSSDDPIRELRVLVAQHKALTRASVAIKNMQADRRAVSAKTAAEKREREERMRCKLPEDVRAAMRDDAKAWSAKASALESQMLVQLRSVPIYARWLKDVYGIGVVVAAYLVTEIDIRIAVKPSQLQRFCGTASIGGYATGGGRLEKPRSPTDEERAWCRENGKHLVGRHYNLELRTRLYQFATAADKNAADRRWLEGSELPDDVDVSTLRSRKKGGRFEYCLPNEPVERPHGWSSKYLDLWQDYMRAHPERRDARNVGRWRALNIFVGDLYLVWRSLEGLPVRPGYYARMRGFEHGSGAVVVDEPRVVTPEDAIAAVGFCGKTVAAQAKVARVQAAEEDEDESEE